MQHWSEESISSVFLPHHAVKALPYPEEYKSEDERQERQRERCSGGHRTEQPNIQEERDTGGKRRGVRTVY